VTRRLGLLGCFVYVPPDGDAPAAARMFAPAIGVPEDVANANSTGCLAAHLLVSTGAERVEVEQGDALGRPATVFASAEVVDGRLRTWVGGLAVIRVA
jgi:predicted PhzF superfamily epimerase YddE/YHI9